MWPSQGKHEDWGLHLVALDATSIFLIRERLEAEEHGVGAPEDGGRGSVMTARSIRSPRCLLEPSEGAQPLLWPRASSLCALEARSAMESW